MEHIRWKCQSMFPKQYDPYSITNGPLSNSAYTLKPPSADVILNVRISADQLEPIFNK